MGISKSLFNKINRVISLGEKRIIDIETLEWFDSLSDCAGKIGCSKPNVYKAILEGIKCKGRRFEYLDVWLTWNSREKEKFTRKNNIYFY